MRKRRRSRGRNSCSCVFAGDEREKKERRTQEAKTTLRMSFPQAMNDAWWNGASRMFAKWIPRAGLPAEKPVGDIHLCYFFIPLLNQAGMGGVWAGLVQANDENEPGWSRPGRVHSCSKLNKMAWSLPIFQLDFFKLSFGPAHRVTHLHNM